MILGIVGPNGAGKTTLFRQIVGEEQPDEGTLTVGQTVVVGYADQSRGVDDPENTVYQEISGGQDDLMMGGRKVNARAYVSRFNFGGGDQQKLVKELSGGERNRLHLAKMLKSGANLMLLDEPTNDLDVATLRALEEGIENFAGAAIVISHDRWFLDRVCTHILAFEGNSETYFFHGSYSEYEEDRRERLGDAADRPHRITYRKLTR
jgi:ATPase subunit of ABC transporter with duplicated ATPase domains